MTPLTFIDTGWPLLTLWCSGQFRNLAMFILLLVRQIGGPVKACYSHHYAAHPLPAPSLRTSFDRSRCTPPPWVPGGCCCRAGNSVNFKCPYGGPVDTVCQLEWTDTAQVRLVLSSNHRTGITVVPRSRPMRARYSPAAGAHIPVSTALSDRGGWPEGGDFGFPFHVFQMKI